MFLGPKKATPQGLMPTLLAVLSGTAEEAAEKRNLPKKQRPQGLKPALISRGLRGPFDRLRAGSEGPLFHGNARICEFFRSL